jgi:hypothetical protein
LFILYSLFCNAFFYDVTGGYPLAYSIHEGNKYEGHTMLPVVNDFVRKFDLKDFVVVAKTITTVKIKLKESKETLTKTMLVTPNTSLSLNFLTKTFGKIGEVSHCQSQEKYPCLQIKIPSR